MKRLMAATNKRIEMKKCNKGLKKYEKEEKKHEHKEGKIIKEIIKKKK